MTTIETIKLSTVDCCATCQLHAGWADNMWCEKHDIEVKPQNKCDDYKTEPVLKERFLAKEIR